jgi:hypothetical protein
VTDAVDEVELRKVFRERLKTVTGLPAVIAWENVVTAPPALPTGGGSVLWMEEVHRLLSEKASSTCLNEAVGEVLYLIFIPKGGGTREADELAQRICVAFRPRQSLTSSAITVMLEVTDRRPYREHERYPGWVFKTVAVQWRSFSSVT